MGVSSCWRIPWTEEPGGLQSMGSQRIRHNWATNIFTLSREGGWQRMRWLDVITNSWKWVWANSGRQWRTGKPGVLQSMVSQRVGIDLATEQQQGNWLRAQSWEPDHVALKFARLYNLVLLKFPVPTFQFNSVAQLCPTLCDPMNHSTPAYPSPTPGVHSDSCPLSRWCHPSSHLILCHPLFLLPPIPPSIRVFSNESTLHMRWPKYKIGKIR